MSALETLRAGLQEAAKDTKLNLQAVLSGQGGVLSVAQRWGVAVASAIAARNPELRDAVWAEAAGQVEANVLEDAKAAATLMAMNNVYYRFRHMVGKPGYSSKPARLRMNRIAQTLGPKVDFELFCLAVSAINGCEMCIRSHEQVVLDGGLTEDHVHEAVRIGAVVNAMAVSLELPPAAQAEGVAAAS